MPRLTMFQIQAGMQPESDAFNLDTNLPDAQPSVMDFYNGRQFGEGRKLHNQYLVSKGLPPIPEGVR